MNWRRLATVDLSPLRHRDFRLLFWGQLISFLGSQVTLVAIPFQIYELTHQPFAVGVLGVVELVPLLTLSFLGGAFADARDRRSMVLLTEVGLTVLSALLLINALQPEPQLIAIYVIAAGHAALFALQRPSLEALLPRLVERHELTAAAALNMLRGTVGMLVGPAIGGVLIATVGLPLTYGVDVVSFAGSLVALYLMRAIPPPEGAESPSIRRVLEGFNYARSKPELIGTYVVDIVAMFFGMPSALFPAIAESMGGAEVLGLLYSAPALGAFIATATSGWTSHVHRHGLAVVVAAVAWGVAIIFFGMATTPGAAVVFLAMAGGADAISGIFRGTIWNSTVPDALRGRLAAIEMVSYTTGPLLGNAESGLVASVFSVPASVISGGVLCVVGCLACAVLLPAFRDYDGRQTSADIVPAVG
jgi:MFS family permease